MSEKLIQCPRCGSNVHDLLKIDTGMRLSLQDSGLADQIPEGACPNCYSDLSALVSKGARLRAEQNAKEQNKKILWKNRVKLLKGARKHMQNKSFSEAAVLYEKYLRVLEIVYDKKAGELFPDLFDTPLKRKELTAISTVYWNLIKIYDSSPRYGERLQRTADKLVSFLPHSRVKREILKEAESFAKSAKNSGVIKTIMRKAGKSRSSCFIATSAFESPVDPTVNQLRSFRELILDPSPFGRAFVRTYYVLSPPLAYFLDLAPVAKRLVRPCLRTISRALAAHFNLPNQR